MVRNIIAALGHPEGYTPKQTKPQTTHNHTDNSNGALGVLGKIVVVGAKVLLGIFLTGWLLAAFAILVGFVALVAMGEQWEQVITVEGVSPVVFAGLICAVVVLFMGIVSDVGFSLLRGKSLNFKRLGIGALVWVVFFLWLVFAAVRNADNWTEWAYRSEMQLELWEEEMDAWEDRMEIEWEDALLNLNGVDKWDSAHTFTFDDFVGAMRFESFCDRFEELEPYEERLEWHLLRGESVVVKVENHYEGDRLYRTFTITSPDGDTVVTSPATILQPDPTGN